MRTVITEAELELAQEYQELSLLQRIMLRLVAGRYARTAARIATDVDPTLVRVVPASRSAWDGKASTLLGRR